MWRLLLVCLAVLAAAACGGDDATPREAADEYFAAMQPIATRVGRDVGAAGDALNAFDPASDTSWKRTARAVVVAERTTADAAEEVDDLDVDDRYDEAQAFYREAVLSMRDLFVSLRTPLEQHDEAELEKVAPTVTSSLTRIRRIVDSWEAEVTHQAKQAGAPVPRWVRESGGVNR